MANRLFKAGIQNLISGGIDLDTDVMKCWLLRGYTPDTANHATLSAITGSGATLVATSAALSSVTVTAGILNAASTLFTSVGAGAACAHIVLGKDTGVAGTSIPLYLIDTATGLSVTPDGGNIQITWDTGANKIINFDA